MIFPFLKEASKNLFSKPSTVEYPNKVTNVDAKPGYRGRIGYDPDRCTLCGKCEMVCCPGAITVTREVAEGGEYVTRAFDLTSCTFCGTCADFCDEGAITMTPDYHMVATNAADLIVRGTKFVEASTALLYCSEDCIFCTLCARNCPHGAITVDRAAKTWEVDHDKCVQCGICVGKCPKKALSFKEPEEIEQLMAARAAKAEAAAAEAAGGAGQLSGATPTAENSPAGATPATGNSTAETATAAGTTGSAENGSAPADNASEPSSGGNKLTCSDACVFCTLCARNCPMEAITVDRAEKRWEVDEDKCVQCGLCVSKCPKKALSFK